VLAPGGRFVLLPLAWITGGSPLERLAAWLFRITGQAPKQAGQIPAGVRDRFARARLKVHAETVRQTGSQLLIFIAQKSF
jgi:hypothetical protein